jgi:hypothetical protein
MSKRNPHERTYSMTRVYDAHTGRLIGHLDLECFANLGVIIPELMWEMTGKEGWRVVSMGYETVYVTR